MGIESSETDTDFVISSEPETATCGETTENETETITEGEYRIQVSPIAKIITISILQLKKIFLTSTKIN